MLSYEVAKRVTEHMLQVYGFEGYFSRDRRSYHPIKYRSRKKGKLEGKVVHLKFKFPK